VCVLRGGGGGEDALIGLEEMEGSDVEEEQEERVAGDELPCPFCGEEFNAIRLYCHIDGEHQAVAKAGVIFFLNLNFGVKMQHSFISNLLGAFSYEYYRIDFAGMFCEFV
jgi:hypothetical protein